jgi:hypothetical protein
LKRRNFFHGIRRAPARGPGDDPYAEDEARKKDCDRAIALEEALATHDSLSGDVEEALIAVEQRASATVPDGVAEVVAHGACGDADQDDVAEVQLTLAPGKEADEQQSDLAGRGNASVLQQQDNASSVKVAVINEDFVKKYFKDVDPLQQRVSVEQLIPGVTKLGPPIEWQIVRKWSPTTVPFIRKGTRRNSSWPGEPTLHKQAEYICADLSFR